MRKAWYYRGCVLATLSAMSCPSPGDPTQFPRLMQLGWQAFSYQTARLNLGPTSTPLHYYTHMGSSQSWW